MNVKLAMTMVGVPVVAAAAGERDGVEVLREKAAGGDAAAQVELAHRYRDGDGVTLDLREALRWGHQAADSGDARAMDFVGWMYFHGKGVEARPEIAVGYFKAAAGKSLQAAWNLGLSHFAGMGTALDVPAALAVWEDAAARGHGRSASTAATNAARAARAARPAAMEVDSQWMRVMVPAAGWNCLVSVRHGPGMLPRRGTIPNDHVSVANVVPSA